MVIYLTKNNINHKYYIGKDSKNDPKYLGSGVLLIKAIAKYGKEHFTKEIIDTATTIDELNLLEQKHIAQYDATNDDMSYNIASGGQGGNTIAGLSSSRLESFKNTIKDRWKNYTAAEREIVSINISNSLKGKKKSESHKNKIRQHKLETAQEYGPKVSKSLKIFWDSESGDQLKIDRLEKCRKSGRDNGMYGIHHTDETKAKISRALRGKPKVKKCSISEIREICKLHNNGASITELATKYSVSHNTIRRYLKSA